MSSKLARVVRRGVSSGEPLPDVYATLRNCGIIFYRAGVTLVSGRSGSMKTTFLLNLMDAMKVPTLYFSNDSNEMTVVSRMLAKRLRQDSTVMRERALSDPAWAADVLAGVDWVRWSFAPSPSLEDIREEVAAFEELWGEMPHLIVVDVLMKVDYDNGTYTTDEDIVRFLDLVARESGAAILVASHASENTPGSPCQPKSALINKIDKLPIMILTTAYEAGIFYVAPVKNRDGFADSTGRTYVTFLIDPSIALLEEVDG